MSANNTQIGGNHYKSDFQHWDFSAHLDLDGQQHTITKYLHRWESKGGVQDLQKVEHHLQKYAELMQSGVLNEVPLTSEQKKHRTSMVAAYCDANRFDFRKSNLIRLVSEARSEGVVGALRALEAARDYIEWVQTKEEAGSYRGADAD